MKVPVTFNSPTFNSLVSVSAGSGTINPINGTSIEGAPIINNAVSVEVFGPRGGTNTSVLFNFADSYAPDGIANRQVILDYFHSLYSKKWGTDQQLITWDDASQQTGVMRIPVCFERRQNPAAARQDRWFGFFEISAKRDSVK